MNVLVVDDSVVFRSQIKAVLDGVKEITNVVTANNGKIALDKLSQSDFDIVTLDLEMPVLNGMETLKEIRKTDKKTRVLIFSSQTQKGSDKTLECLSLGADDFVAKPSGDQGSFDKAADAIKSAMLPKIMQFVHPATSSSTSTAPVHTGDYVRVELDTFIPEIVLIGSSTGGPPALDKVLSLLNRKIRVPILICQHMPPVFTASLASRIQSKTGVPAKEAVDGEALENKIYVAPGDYHLRVEKSGEQVFLKTSQDPPQNMVRPAVDPLFETAAKVWGKKAMAFVLTGMGFDGKIGCEFIKRYKGGVMIQDKTSCTVYGMPKAVHDSGAFDKQGNLEDIANYISRFTK